MTTDAFSAVHESDISFICVGTPSLSNGRLAHIEARLSTNLEDVIKRPQVVVIGTTELNGADLQSVAPPDQIVIDLRSLLPPSMKFAAPNSFLFSANQSAQNLHA